jgi:hypothetical protein
MLWFALLAISAAKPPTIVPSPAAVQARATVRVISGIRLKLNSRTNAGAPPARETMVSADGAKRVARLVEFE